MADMKLDEAKLLKSLEHAAERAQGELRIRIDNSKAEVAVVARALRDTPDSTLELFKHAKIALVEEVVVDGSYGSADLNVQVRIGPRQFEMGSSRNAWANAEAAKDGRYRALFFLVRID